MGPVEHQHSDANSLIQNQMEGLTPHAVLSHRNAAPPCF
jgi:hypothetical protein